MFLTDTSPSWGQLRPALHGDCCNVSFFHRKGKTDTPKSPTTPTSPMSPSFTSAGGPLSPHLATGDSIRDKCIEMLTAALHTDSEAKITLCYWEHTPQQLKRSKHCLTK